MKFLKLIAAAVLMLAAAGCAGSSGNDEFKPFDLNKSIALENYTSCEELEAELKEILVGQMEARLEEMGVVCLYGGGPEGPMPVSDTADTAEAGATDTNLQEAGVDEADLIKSDGEYVYAVVNNRVRIVRVWPFAEFGLVATIEPQMEAKNIYLVDDRLIVLGVEQTSIDAGVEYWAVPQYDSTTVEEVYDVSTPSSPSLVKRAELPGSLLDSRRIGANVHMVMNKGVEAPAFDYELQLDYEDLPACSSSGELQTTEAFRRAVEELRVKNLAIAETLTIADLLPAVAESDAIDCTDIARSPAASGTELLILATDSFADATSQATVTAVLGSGGSIYASRDAIYVAENASAYGWWGVPDYEFEDKTIVHRFGIDDDRVYCTGSGQVEGHLVDNSFAGSRYSERFSMQQFAMSEHEGYLRIATTVGYVASGESDNRVEVLDIATNDLSSVGEVSGLGRGERIYSVRFAGDKAYVVTFKKVDPLYVVNLSDPKSPAVVGELEIPGFSTYLHPLDEGHLIGLGFGADDQDFFAWTQGLKLALFDVSNPALPTEIGHREIGTRGSYSPAIEEHHAFTLDSERGLLALPVEIYEGSGVGGDWGIFEYSGVLLLRADESGTFATEGRVVVEEGGVPSVSLLRAIIIGDGVDDGVITLTSDGIMLNRIDASMTPVGAIDF